MKTKHLLCFLPVIIIWLVFYPGNMSLDSYWMYFDALNGTFSDSHSLFLPRLLFSFFAVNLYLPYITFIQVALGVFGLENLLVTLAKLIEIKPDSRVNVFTITLELFFFLPITPFSIYLATLSTDTWLLISLLWFSYFLVEIYQSEDVDKLKLTMCLVFGGMLLVARNNSFALFPSVTACLLLALFGKMKNLYSMILIAFTPLITSSAFIFIQYVPLNVARTHEYRVSYALDIASMIVYDKNICNDLYFQSCALVTRSFPSEFLAGDGAIDFTFNQGANDVNKAFLNLFEYPRLEKEYWWAVREYPLVLMKVKLLNYLDYISPDPTRYFFQDHYPVNAKETGLNYFVLQSDFSKIWFASTNWTINQPILRWISFVHLPWLLVNFLLIIFFLHRLQKGRKLSVLLTMSMISINYYASYLIALTASEFRFMYPATFLVQIIALSLVFAYATRWLPERRNLRAARPLRSRRGKRSAGRSAGSPS